MDESVSYSLMSGGRLPNLYFSELFEPVYFDIFEIGYSVNYFLYGSKPVRDFGPLIKKLVLHIRSRVHSLPSRRWKKWSGFNIFQKYNINSFIPFSEIFRRGSVFVFKQLVCPTDIFKSALVTNAYNRVVCGDKGICHIIQPYFV